MGPNELRSDSTLNRSTAVPCDGPVVFLVTLVTVGPCWPPVGEPTALYGLTLPFSLAFFTTRTFVGRDTESVEPSCGGLVLFFGLGMEKTVDEGSEECLLGLVLEECCPLSPFPCCLLLSPFSLSFIRAGGSATECRLS